MSVTRVSLAMPGSKTEIRPRYVMRSETQKLDGPRNPRGEIKTGNGETMVADEIYDPKQIC